MDWGSILLSGICGVIGAVTGLLVAKLLGPLFSLAGESFKGVVSALLVMIGLATGIAMLPPYVGPYAEPLIAKIIPEKNTDDDQIQIVEKDVISESVVAAAIDDALVDLQDPFFEAVLQKEPSRAESVKGRLVSAYKRGGQAELVEELLQADQEIIRTAFPYYMARGREEDLLAAVNQISTTIRLLSEQDPGTCHLWLYGSIIGQNFDFDKYIQAVGEEGHLALQARLAAVVQGALDFPPDYDEAYAEQVLADIGDRLMDQLGVEKIGLLTSGQRPEDDADAKLACDASAEFYDLILSDEKAVDVLRHRYITSAF